MLRHKSAVFTPGLVFLQDRNGLLRVPLPLHRLSIPRADSNRNVTLELVGLVVSAWHAHVLNEAGGQERHQWFCPRTLVPPVLIFRRALHERLRQLGEACRGPRARG